MYCSIEEKLDTTFNICTDYMHFALFFRVLETLYRLHCSACLKDDSAIVHVVFVFGIGK